MVVSLVVSTLCYPGVLNFARKHGILDNPDNRKLQRRPVPVMGGVVVYAGILVSGLILNSLMYSDILAYGLISMAVMMLIGVWDDVKDLSVGIRFTIEIVLVTVFILATGTYIDDFHGVWGIYKIHPYIGVPFSVFVGVGIMNAVNLIDGMDGYLSGYGVLACICFGLALWSAGSLEMGCLAIIVVGALLPFFLHNVFGIQSKMFIGDGGTLMLGMLMTVLVFFTMSSKHHGIVLMEKGVGLAAFIMAVLCIPVFDMARVFLLRILRGKSPFRPDRNHLHHLFIDMGFSHFGAALSIIMINTMVVLIWMVSWILGASIDVQTYVVLGLGIIVTFGLYNFVKIQQYGGPINETGSPQGTRLWHAMAKLGSYTKLEEGRFWKMMRCLIDGPLSGLHSSENKS